MVMRVRVVRTNGELVDLRAPIPRFTGCLLRILTLSVGFLMIAFDAREQTLYGKTTDTYVISVSLPEFKQHRSDRIVQGMRRQTER